MSWTPFLLAASLVVSSPIFADVMQPQADLSEQQKPATIKVLIADKKDKVFLEARGKYQVYSPLNNAELDRGIMTKRAYVTSSIEGIEWNGAFPGVFQIRITPTDAKSSILVEGIEYRGCVEIYAIQGKLYVVNEIDVERYLKATLTPQLTENLSPNVLEAVAILARTQAYHSASKTGHAYWHVKADEVGYTGYGLALQNALVETAVNNTRYLVLTHNHTPFATSWTKNSGGKTADFSVIFRKDSPACHAVDAPFAKRDREKSAWSFSLSHAELSKALKMEGVSGIDLYQDPKTQKVYAVRIKDKKGTKDLDFFKFQELIGEQKLRSNDFSVQSHGGQIAFHGHGEGHGVGLCLYQAEKMAENGEAAPKILASFFPETKLETLKTVGDKSH